MNVPAPNDPELDSLLGAYALDALDPEERLRVEAYLATNARARDEVDELRESAAALALAPVDDATAPADLWHRIAGAIDADIEHAGAPDADSDNELAEVRARRRALGVRWLSLAAAAAVVVALLLASQVVSLHHRLDNVPNVGETAAARAFVRAGRTPGAKQLTLMPANGGEVARVVLLPDGSGYLKNDNLAQLDADHTYQLWALTGTAEKPVAISAGVLGPNPKAAAFRTTTDVHEFALTIERNPGVGQSTQAPYASATVT